MPKYQNHPNAIKLISRDFKIEIDFHKLYKSMGDAIASAVDRKLGSTARNLIESVTTVNETEKQAFSLVFNAINNACVSLLKKYHQEKIDRLKLRENFEALRTQTSNDIQRLQIVLSPDIFSNPTQFPFIKKYQQIWLKWLQLGEGLNLDAAAAHKLAKEFPQEFGKAIRELWSEFPENYESIREYFANPFHENAGRQEALSEYYKKIESLWTSSIFKEENLTLENTYIQPNFKVSNRNYDKNKETHFKQEADIKAAFTAPDYLKGIHDYINNYFLKNKKAFGDKVAAEDSRLLLLLGQPGQGKTSFCTKVVNDICNDLTFNRDLIFLKLRNIDFSAREFLNNTFESLERQFKEYRFDYDNAVIILDGLDELYMTNGLTNDEITEFIRSLTKKISNRPNTHIIVTSRYHYVQLDDVSRRGVLVLSLSPLTLEQQKKWLKIYHTEHPKGELTEELLTEINEEGNLQFKEIRELINQPILLYLVTKADFKIKSSDNRAKIYDELFNVLVKRSSGPLEKQERLEDDKEGFRKYIGAVAFKIYNSNKEWITSKELNEMEATKRFINDFRFGNIENALKEVLISFYFQPINNTNTSSGDRSYSVEFFHKSLQEYLAAEHIWRTILDGFTKKVGEYYVIDKWEDGLKLIWELGAKKGLTPETSIYIREIIENYESAEKKQLLHERLYGFMNIFFSQDFIYKYDISDGDSKPISKAVDCFYLYWTIFSSINKNTIIDLRESGDSFSNLLRMKLDTRRDFMSLSLVKLQGVNFRGMEFFGVDFQNAYLQDCNFSYVFIKDGNFRNSTLINNLFTNSRINNIDFSYSIFENNHFNNSDFMNSVFSYCKFRKCSFIEAKISTAHFYAVELANINFEKASISFSMFTDATLIKCNLRGCYIAALIENTVFDAVPLEGVFMNGCDVRKTIFKNGRFDHTKMNKCTLVEVKFEENYFVASEFIECVFEKVDFKKSEFEKIKLIRTDIKNSNLLEMANSREVIIED